MIADDNDARVATAVTLAAVGAVGIGLGIAFGVLSQSRGDDAVVEPVQRRAGELHDEASSFATASNISFIAGGVLLAGGATWLIIELATQRGPSSTNLSLGAGSLKLTGGF